MSIDHNRIKVADLETNQSNKTLVTNDDGELEFKNISEIKTESYNALDYTVEGKVLDARQGKVLKDLIDTINELLASDNINLNTIQKLGDAIETVQNSLSITLVNDLTTGGATKVLTAEMGKVLQTNKVDKAAGERLINAAEITKLSGLANVTTTIKTVSSAVLPTQNVAGFVTYINTLNPVLVAGSNEIVRYTTSDTGRTFELNLRGRSFGVGQPAIVAANVIEITEFLNKDIRLSNYSSTRNDGVNPTNKVLGTDANGNLKLYTIATSPAPFLKELIPSSQLPNATGNFILKGSFFTPTMTVAITGQTVNYVTFISDNEVHANVTTGAAEGLFSVTLNNGLSAIFNNVLMIVLGTIFSPLTSDWVFKTGAITITDNKVETLSYTSVGSAIWNKELDWTKNFEVRCKPKKSPLGIPTGYTYSFLQLLNVSDSSNKLNLAWNYAGSYVQCRTFFNSEAYTDSFVYSGATPLDTWNASIENIEIKIKWLSGVLTLWHNNILKKTYSSGLTQNLKLKASVFATDLYDIKYIELAT